MSCEWPYLNVMLLLTVNEIVIATKTECSIINVRVVGIGSTAITSVSADDPEFVHVSFLPG